MNCAKYIVYYDCTGSAALGDTLEEAFQSLRKDTGEDCSVDDVIFFEISRMLNVETKIVEVQKLVESPKGKVPR